MGLYQSFQKFFKKVCDIIATVAGSKEARERLLEEIRRSKKALSHIFTRDWSQETEESKRQAVADVKLMVTEQLIPTAGALSLMGLPGLIVYTPCQVAGALAIAYIHNSSFAWRDNKNIITVLAILFWGKTGQLTFQTLLHLLRDILPAPGLGLAVIPFVQLWTNMAFDRVDDYYSKKTTAPVADVGPEDEEDLKAKDADVNEVTRAAKRMGEQLARGGKILFQAQRKIVDELCSNADGVSAIELGYTHLFQGVAGSGKTVIMTHILPRLAEAFENEHDERPQILVYHYNNYLRQLLYVEIVKSLKEARPEANDIDKLCRRMVKIHTLSTLNDKLSEDGFLLGEQGETSNNAQRAQDTRRRLTHCDGLFDIILIDEGQDIATEEYQLIYDLCRVSSGKDKSVFVFYDDFQTIFGAQKNVKDRLGETPVVEHFLTQCVRSTKQIVDFTINTCTNNHLDKDTYSHLTEAINLPRLMEKDLIKINNDGYIDCRFCVFPGEQMPVVRKFKSNAACISAVCDDIQGILTKVDGHIYDGSILVLCITHKMVNLVANALSETLLLDKVRVRSGKTIENWQKRDSLAVERGAINIATIGDAKGYDADVVYILNPDGIGEGASEIEKRLRFYVAATRAKQFLAVFSSIPKNDTIIQDARKALQLMGRQEP